MSDNILDYNKSEKDKTIKELITVKYTNYIIKELLNKDLQNNKDFDKSSILQEIQDTLPENVFNLDVASKAILKAENNIKNMDKKEKEIVNNIFEKIKNQNSNPNKEVNKKNLDDDLEK